MAFLFADGFDCYAAPADATAGYWDSGLTNTALVAGRFTGSRAWSVGVAATGISLTKSSGVNDSIHHVVFAIQMNALSSANHGFTLHFIDNTTTQCSVAIRGDGTMLLFSGAAPVSGGTPLATYTGAVSATNTWTAFEVEIVISNTAGSIAVRKNGNTANDFSLGSLNTRAGTNNYANKLSIGRTANDSATHILDDINWRSDSVSVPWVGDIRCYSRLPVSDVIAQFARNTSQVTQTVVAGTTLAASATVARYSAVTLTYGGSISGLMFAVGSAGTGNLKWAIFASGGTQAPTTILASGGPVALPASGNVSVTVSPPVSASPGTTIWIGTIQDNTTSIMSVSSSSSSQTNSTVTYAAFPVASPICATGNQIGPALTVSYAANSNYILCAESQQDSTSTYVYDSTVGDADLYNIAGISGTPANTVAVITRGYFQKSDAGARGAAVQLKSGAAAPVQSTPTLLSTSWGWLYRVDTTDPATGAPWTAAAVNNLQIGPVVTS